jgi:hypothetical protein
MSQVPAPVSTKRVLAFLNMITKNGGLNPTPVTVLEMLVGIP